MRVLQDNPVCEVCLAAGQLTEATDVDHIQPHEGDYEVFHDRTNLWAICKSCHAMKSSYEAQGMRFLEGASWGQFLARKKRENRDNK